MRKTQSPEVCSCRPLERRSRRIGVRDRERPVERARPRGPSSAGSTRSSKATTISSATGRRSGAPPRASIAAVAQARRSARAIDGLSGRSSGRLRCHGLPGRWPDRRAWPVRPLASQRFEDHPLRRRRPAPAARDPAREGARAARRRGRPQPGRARPARGRRARGSSTSPTRRPCSQAVADLRARRRAHRLGRPRRAGRRRDRRGARPAGDRRRDRAPDDAQGRDAARSSRTRACRSRGSRRCARSAERRLAADEVGFPAVLKPADSGGQRGVFRVDSLDDVETHLHEALIASPTGEAILEEFVDGHGDERDRDRARRRGDPAHALRPAAPARDRLRRRLDPPLPGDDLRRPARGVGARRDADGAHARPARPGSRSRS